MIKKKNLKKLLNLNFVDLTNRTYNLGKYNLSYVKCPNLVNPDYLALYSETYNYHILVYFLTRFTLILLFLNHIK